MGNGGENKTQITVYTQNSSCRCKRGVGWGSSASCMPGLHQILVTPWVGTSMIPGFHEETQTTCSRSRSQREAEPGVRPR